jgi:hypothetical protein
LPQDPPVSQRRQLHVKRPQRRAAHGAAARRGRPGGRRRRRRRGRGRLRGAQLADRGSLRSERALLRLYNRLEVGQLRPQLGDLIGAAAAAAAVARAAAARACAANSIG